MAVVRTEAQAAAAVVSEMWWLLVVQAVLAIIFGLVAVFWPGLTLVVLVYLIGAFVIAIGLAEVVRGLVSTRSNDTWWLTLLLGLALLGAGVYLARHPQVSFTTFIVLVGITFIVWGVVTFVRAFMDDLSIGHKVFNFVAGLAAVAVGIYTFFQPVSGGLAFVWAYGLFALVYGMATLAMAIEHHRDYAAARSVLHG
jgi:uncharacterized membrane protein HdeD (DUF308 family)